MRGVAPGLAVNTIEPFARTHPQDALRSSVYSLHVTFTLMVRNSEIVRDFLKQRRLRRIVGGARSVEAGPDIPFPIREKADHAVLSQAFGIGRIVAVTDESPVVPVELQQAGSLRCNPQSASLVFNHSHYAGQSAAGRFPFFERIVSQRVRFAVEHG